MTQLFNRANQTLSRELGIIMAKEEICRRFANPIRLLWWKLPGTEITVKWPIGWTEPEPAPGGGFNQSNSADPNDHFRPWLETNVGKQGRDWDWRLNGNSNEISDTDTLVIKFRKGRGKYATMFILKYSKWI